MAIEDKIKCETEMAEALDKARTENRNILFDFFHPDLIFMDIKLPGESGLELTKQIKDEFPETIVIVLTNYDLPEYRVAAYESGADHFLGKGLSTAEEILGLVDSVLDPDSSVLGGEA